MRFLCCATFISFAMLSILQPVYFFHPEERHYEEHDHHPETSTSIDEYHTDDVKMPRFIMRKYLKYYKSPGNFTYLYHSKPVEVTHIKDDLFQLSALYRESNNKLLSLRLWLEFPDIKRSKELQNSEFIMEITPVIGSRDMNRYSDVCSTALLVSQARFPDGILELRFDITTLYEACKARDVQPKFKYKILFYPLDDLININLKKDKVDMYIIFKERHDYPDISDYYRTPDNKLVLFSHLIQQARLEHSAMEDFYDTSDNELLHHSYLVRKARSVESRQRKPGKSCTLRPFIFHFYKSSFNDYIKHPASFNLNKCQGVCAFPLRKHLNYTNYAVIKSISNIIYKNVRKPSCIAQELDKLLTVVKDDIYGLTLKENNDMIARSCKCC